MNNNFEIFINNRYLYNQEYIDNICSKSLDLGLRINIPSFYTDVMVSDVSIGINIESMLSLNSVGMIESQIQYSLSSNRDYIINIGLYPIEFKSVLLKQIKMLSRYCENIRPILDIQYTMHAQQTINILDIIEQSGINQCILTTNNKNTSLSDFLIEIGLSKKHTSLDISTILNRSSYMDSFHKFQDMGVKTILSRPNMILNLLS